MTYFIICTNMYSICTTMNECANWYSDCCWTWDDYNSSVHNQENIANLSCWSTGHDFSTWGQVVCAPLSSDHSDHCEGILNISQPTGRHTSSLSVVNISSFLHPKGSSSAVSMPSSLGRCPRCPAVLMAMWIPHHLSIIWLISMWVCLKMLCTPKANGWWSLSRF